MQTRHWSVAAAALAAVLAIGQGANASPALELESKIPLGPVKGRIDHLAVDLVHRRLFVAELGDDTVGVVDLRLGKTIATIGGQHEPQGVVYSAKADTLFVASGGDGALRLYRGDALAPAGAIHIGDDADNVRLDPRDGVVMVGSGRGSISLVNPALARVTGEIKLKGHPESFALGPEGRLYANVPEARQVAVADLARKVQVGSWSLGLALQNFPLAIAPDGNVLVVTRLPAELISIDPRTGKIAVKASTCGDSDDLFFDARRSLIYVSCGDGHMDVFEASGGRLAKVDHLPTSPGARTSLFVPEFDRLYVAVRANGTTPAAIWVYRPTRPTKP